MTLPERALEIARSQVGVRELGKNAGPAVEKFLAAVHLERGNPWCCAFICWAFQRASSEQHALCPVPVTGSVHRLWERAPSWARVPRPVPGAVFLMEHSSTTGHTGIVAEVIDDKTIRTVEGNTNPGGSREGDGVYLRTRRLDEINLGFLLFDLDAARDQHEVA